VQGPTKNFQQIPMGEVGGKWTILALDMQSLHPCNTPYKALKSIQFCANMRARGAFTSHIKCDLTDAFNRWSYSGNNLLFLGLPLGILFVMHHVTL
jgi:hypothetical protein